MRRPGARRGPTATPSGRPGGLPVVVACLLLVCTSGATPVAPAASPAGDDEPRVVYTPPVDAPVADPFRAPSSPYGPGNRGIEYHTRPGTPVHAAATGTVTFAGQVAGSLYVTLHHADGIRTTYSYLRRIDVSAGQRVRRGHVVGLATDHLMVSARLGDRYLDPASLWRGALRVFLVPLNGYTSGAARRRSGR